MKIKLKRSRGVRGVIVYKPETHEGKANTENETHVYQVLVHQPFENLTKLESFAVKNTFDQVNFYIDIEGHIEDPSLQKALEELGFHTQKLDILGVYKANQFRFKK